jgi:hypothetical protein
MRVKITDEELQQEIEDKAEHGLSDGVIFEYIVSRKLREARYNPMVHSLKRYHDLEEGCHVLEWTTLSDGE